MDDLTKGENMFITQYLLIDFLEHVLFSLIVPSSAKLVLVFGSLDDSLMVSSLRLFPLWILVFAFVG